MHFGTGKSRMCCVARTESAIQHVATSAQQARQVRHD